MNEKLTLRKLHSQPALSHFAGPLEDVCAVGNTSITQCLRAGDFYSLLPPRTTEKQAYEFKQGGILRNGLVHKGTTLVQEVSPPFDEMARLIATRIRLGDEPILWVHEPLMSESEIKLEALHYQRIGAKIYLTYDCLDQEEIAKALSLSLLSWHFVAFVTYRTDHVRSVSSLLDHSKMILVGAYDGESVLMWESRS